MDQLMPIDDSVAARELPRRSR